MKKHLITGLAILLPIVLTLMVIFWLIDFFTAPFVPLVTSKIFNSHGILNTGSTIFISRMLALLFLSIFIFLLGVVARWFLIKNILSVANRILSRIPLIKTVYKVSRDIALALFSLDGKKAFKYPVMIPFPHQSTYTVGFQAGEVTEEILAVSKEPLVSVFAPTAPHPITGFIFFVPQKNVHKLNMTNEEAVKFIVSCGLIHPDIDLVNKQ